MIVNIDFFKYQNEPSQYGHRWYKLEQNLAQS